jgi:site-specific DNA recombinase
MDQIELEKIRKRAAGTFLAQPARNQSRIKRVAIYARASTKKQDMSVADQKTVLDEYISRQKGWECVGFFGEVESGKRRRKRAQYLALKKLMAGNDTKSGSGVDIVLVNDMSRLGRNLSEVLKFMEVARHYGVEIHTTQGPVEHTTAMALAFVAELQVNVTKEQIKRAHFAITMDGRHVGTPPYGYICAEVDGRKGNLEIHEEEAKIVRLIFKQYLEGKSPRAICRMLNAVPVLSPKGKKWRTCILTHKGCLGMLHNVVYKGWVCYNMTERREEPIEETISHKIRPIDEWKIVKGKHVEIINESDFDAAQVRFANRTRVNRGDRSPPGPLALFAGRMKCPHCTVINPDESTIYGTMYITGAGRNRQTRVACGGVGNGTCENRRSYIRSEIYEAVLQTLRTHLAHPKVITAFLREHAALGKMAQKGRGKEMARLQKEISSLTAERDNFITAIGKGGDADLLNREIAALKQRIADATATVDAFVADTSEFKIDLPSVERYLELIDDVLARLTHSPSSQPDKPLIEELNALVDRIMVYPKEGDRGFEVEVVGKLAEIVTGKTSFRGKGSAPNNIVKCTTLTAQDAAQMLTITYPRASSLGYVPFHKKVEDILADDVEPVTMAMIQNRLADIGVVANLSEVDRAIRYRREAFVNVRRQGFMLKAIYDALPLKWFETTDGIIEAAERGLRALAQPASIEQILASFEEGGNYIHGNGAKILRKSMSQSGRFIVASQKPTLWQLR